VITAQLDLTRLAKLLGMCSSAHEGERANAARMANDMVRSSGASWEEVLDGADHAVAVEACRQLLAENEQLQAEVERLRSNLPAPRPPQPWASAESWRDGAEALLLWREHLSGWERHFLTSLLGRSSAGLSTKQAAALSRIGEKVDRLLRVQV
jgi:hypothetical protein